MKQRSLVAFTLLAQTAVGAVWTVGLLYPWAVRRAGFIAAEELESTALLAIGPVMVTAMLASFFHLGTPINAWRALANLRSSWLSREVLFAVLFTAASCLLSGSIALGVGALAREALIWLAGLIGLGLMISMANVYRLRTVPAWNTWVTLPSFMLTALTLGGLFVGILLSLDCNIALSLARNALQWMASSAVIWLGLQMLVIVLWLTQLSQGLRAATEAMGRIEQRPALLRVRLGLATLALAMAGTALSPVWALINPGILMLLIFALALASEILGRLLFYETKIRQGV